MPAPSGFDGNVLLAADAERSGRRQNAGTGGKFPKQLACGGIESVHVAIIRAAAEDNSTTGHEHRSPVGTICKSMGPHALPCVDIPSLNLADMIRPGLDRETSLGADET